MLALVHRQVTALLKLLRRRVPGAIGGVHATRLGHRALEHPLGQRRLAQRLAGVDVFLDHLGHVQPTGFLPQLKRALLHAEAPAHGLVHVARGLGNGGQVHRGVMEAVAQDRPQELALRSFAVAQQAQAFTRRALEHAAVHLVGLLAGGHVLAALQLVAHDVAAHLLEEPAFGLLTQLAGFNQGLEHRRRAEALVERIGVQRQVVLQRLDHVGHGVQAHHVGGAEGAAAGAAQALAREVVDHVVGEAEVLHLFHGRQHAGDADAVGHEVGRVLGAHHALAQPAGHKGFQVVQDLGFGGGRVDQLHQRHVARRVEEVDTAETRLDRVWQALAQLGDRQAGGVGRHDGVLGHKRRDLFVEIVLPVHALGDGLDDEVATAQQFQVLFVVGLANQRCVSGHTQRRWLELLQAFDSAGDDAVLRAFLGRQVEQHHRHLEVDQMGRDLRTHHARAQNGDFVHLKSFHRIPSICVFPASASARCLHPRAPRIRLCRSASAAPLRGSRAARRGWVLFNALPDLGPVKRPDVAPNLQLFAFFDRRHLQRIGLAVFRVEDVAPFPNRFRRPTSSHHG